MIFLQPQYLLIVVAENRLPRPLKQSIVVMHLIEAIPAVIYYLYLYSLAGSSPLS
jgi:hypothetical protein